MHARIKRKGGMHPLIRCREEPGWVLEQGLGRSEHQMTYVGENSAVPLGPLKFSVSFCFHCVFVFERQGLHTAAQATTKTKLDRIPT